MIAHAAFHSAHYALVVGVPVIVAIVLWSRGSAVRATVEDRAAREARYLQGFGIGFGAEAAGPRVRYHGRSGAAVASAAAGVVHALAANDHFEPLALGILFGLVGAGQLGWAAAMSATPSRRLAWAGIVGNALIAVIWAATRASGAAPVGGPDLSATLLELTVIAASIRSLKENRCMPRTSLAESPHSGDSPGVRHTRTA